MKALVFPERKSLFAFFFRATGCIRVLCHEDMFPFLCACLLWIFMGEY